MNLRHLCIVFPHRPVFQFNVQSTSFKYVGLYKCSRCAMITIGETQRIDRKYIYQCTDIECEGYASSVRHDEPHDLDFACAFCEEPMTPYGLVPGHLLNG